MAGDFGKPQELVAKGTAVFNSFMHDPNMSWFSNNSDAGFLAKEIYKTKLLTSIEISNNPVAGAITLTYSSEALPQLGSNNTIVLYPSANQAGVTWACDAGTIVERFRPPQCR